MPAVVLTHFHADHVDGLEGVLAGREVGEVQVTSLREPAYGADAVDRSAREHDVPVRVPAYGERSAVGEVAWQVVGPQRVVGENPNDASLVLLVETEGLRILLAGDAEPPEQGQLEAPGSGTSTCSRSPTTAAATRTTGSSPSCSRRWRWCRWGRATTTATPPRT